MSVDIKDFIHFIKQLTNPVNPLIDSVQMFMDTNKDLIAQIHDEKDPGEVIGFQLVDFDGYVEIPVGNQAIDLLAGHFFKSTPDQNAIWTTTSARQGHFVWIHVDNTAGKTITFSTGFTDVDAISSTGIQNKILYYDGATWREIATGGGGLSALTQNYIYRGNASNEAEETSIIQVESDGEVIITLGDNAGVKKLTIKDSDGAVILTIDSDGLLDGTASGFTPDGTTAKITNAIGGTGLPPGSAPEGTVYYRHD